MRLLGFGITGLVFGLSFLSVEAQTNLSVRLGLEPKGSSTKYIGMNGGDYFHAEDVRDSGINTYRIFAGMERWEPSDDNGVYGLPTIDRMKSVLSANPSLINLSDSQNEFVKWNRFDAQMRPYLDQIGALHAAGIAKDTVIVLRKSANWGNVWVPRQWPNSSKCEHKKSDGSIGQVYWKPFTQEDWNEIWQFIVAVVYQINVRQGMQVDRWSAHNEPDLREQGWCGTTEMYLEYVKYFEDAIDWVYKTYLNDRPRFIHGGGIAKPHSSNYLQKLFRPGAGQNWADRNFYRPSMFDIVDYHVYHMNLTDRDFAKHVRHIRNLMNDPAADPSVKNKPLWMTEWGHLTSASPWENTATVVKSLGASLIDASTPGPSHLEGLLAWRMFDSKSFQGQGVVHVANGTTRMGRRPDYHALKLMTRALAGGKTVLPLQFSSSSSSLKSIAVKDGQNAVSLVFANTSSTQAFHIEADLGDLIHLGTAEVFRFSANRKGEEVHSPEFRHSVTLGLTRFAIPAMSIVVAKASGTQRPNRPPVVQISSPQTGTSSEPPPFAK